MYLEQPVRVYASVSEYSLRRTQNSAPLLVILSPQDESIDAMETADILRGLRDAGRDISVRIHDGYDHGMHRLGVHDEEIRWPVLSQYQSENSGNLLLRSYPFVRT